MQSRIRGPWLARTADPIVALALLAGAGCSGNGGGTAAEVTKLDESELAAIRASSKSPAEFIAAVKAKRVQKLGLEVTPQPPANSKPTRERR